MARWDPVLEDDYQSILDVPLAELQPLYKCDFTRPGVKNLTEAVRRLFLVWEQKHVTLINFEGKVIEPCTTVSVKDQTIIVRHGMDFALENLLNACQQFWLQPVWGKGDDFKQRTAARIWARKGF